MNILLTINEKFVRQALLLPSERFNYRYGKALLQGIEPAEDIRLLHFAGEAAPYKPWDLLLEEDEAERTPVYDSLKAEMEIKKEWFGRTISGYLRRMIQTITKGERAE